MKAPSEIRGVCPAVITPFGKDGNVDYEMYKKHASNLFDKGASGLCIGGSSGEFEALSYEEVMEIAKTAVAVAAERNGYVIAGMGGRSTAEAIRYAQAYEKIGVDLLLVLPPYYYGFTREEIIQFYLDIAASVKIPLMIYNNPGKTHVKITADMIAELAEKADNIKFTKDSSEDVRMIYEVIKQTGGKVTVFAGWDSIMLESLLMGAEGVFSGGGGNIITAEVVALYNLAMAKDYEGAMKQYHKIRPLLELVEDHGRLAAWLKAGVKLTCYDVGVARKPYALIREDELAQLTNCLKEMGAI
ncbi:4-hydroxy-tetrahydrodipicolinate synthase [Bacillota bacterium]